jgi:hypothetical protein
LILGPADAVFRGSVDKGEDSSLLLYRFWSGGKFNKMLLEIRDTGLLLTQEHLEA